MSCDAIHVSKTLYYTILSFIKIYGMYLQIKLKEKSAIFRVFKFFKLPNCNSKISFRDRSKSSSINWSRRNSGVKCCILFWLKLMTTKRWVWLNNFVGKSDNMFLLTSIKFKLRSFQNITESKFSKWLFWSRLNVHTWIL